MKKDNFERAYNWLKEILDNDNHQFHMDKVYYEIQVCNLQIYYYFLNGTRLKFDDVLNLN